MAKTAIHVKVDKGVRDKAKEFARELGLPLSAIVNANLKEFIRTGEATFSLEPKIKSKIWEELKRASSDYKRDRNVSRRFASAKEAIDYLNA